MLCICRNADRKASWYVFNPVALTGSLGAGFEEKKKGFCCMESDESHCDTKVRLEVAQSKSQKLLALLTRKERDFLRGG
jgi:hypothetical protein